MHSIFYLSYAVWLLKRETSSEKNRDHELCVVQCMSKTPIFGRTSPRVVSQFAIWTALALTTFHVYILYIYLYSKYLHRDDMPINKTLEFIQCGCIWLHEWMCVVRMVNRYSRPFVCVHCNGHEIIAEVNALKWMLFLLLLFSKQFLWHKWHSMHVFSVCSECKILNCAHCVHMNAIARWCSYVRTCTCLL